MDRRSFLSLPVVGVVMPVIEAVFPAELVVSGEGAGGKAIDFKSNVPATGSWPARWICGSASCMDNTDPPVQVHWYNEHTAYLRENKAYSYEAPFMHLYFGNERILFLDQGFTQMRNDWDLRAAVDGCIGEWCARNGRKPEDLELLLAFSHLHSDHYAARDQFFDRPNTRYMGLTHEEMIGFWGMTNFPEQRVVVDLGGRDIWVWGAPGHVISEFAYYDTYTQILYTGDMFYRGRCYISFWQPWFDSMTRLMKFVDEHPVTHVIGCHVECSKTGADYAYGMTYQPDEAPPQLTVAELRHAYEVAKTVTKPGIYFTGSVYLCNQTRSYTTIDRNPYAYA